MAESPEKPIVVYGALAANVAIAVTKFIVAGITGSSAMLSEGIHSIVDSGNELLLLLGLRRAAKRRDAQHPYGYGRELYFWSLMVAVVLFAVGGGVSFYEGVEHLLHPKAATKLEWSFITLGAAFTFEGISFAIGLKKLGPQERSIGAIWRSLQASKDPTVFTIVVEDAAALTGLVVAAVGVVVGHFMRSPIPDAIASCVIGVMLATVAVFLTRKSGGLLVGEAASDEVIGHIRRIAEAEEGVSGVAAVLTTHHGPDEIVANVRVAFDGEARLADVTIAIARIQARVRREVPGVHRMFVEPSTRT